MADDAVDEVRVLGRREAPTAQTTNRTEIRDSAGAFGDPFRAIDTSPSLVPTLSGLPYFFVRGAPPSAVGYYLDGVRVPYLFHFALGPGVIHPALVESVSLYADAFPAEYGRYAGGVVAGRVREPPSELHGEAQIRLFDAGAFAEGRSPTVRVSDGGDRAARELPRGTERPSYDRPRRHRARLRGARANLRVDAGHGSPASGRHDRRPSRRRPRRGRVGDPRRRERPRCVRGPRGGAPVPPSAVEPPPRAAPDTSSHGPQFLGGLAGGLLSSRGTRAR